MAVEETFDAGTCNTEYDGTSTGLFPAKPFLNIVEKLKAIKFKGLEEYSADAYLFMPFFWLFSRRITHKRSRHNLTPFFGESADYELLGNMDDPRTLLFYSERYQGRKDMDEIVEHVSEYAVQPLVFWGVHRKRLDVRALGNLRYLCSWNKTLSRLGVEKSDRPLLFAFLARARNFIRYLKKYERFIDKANCFVTLWDQACDEALFVEFCQKRGMKTATLQHGIFFGSKDFKNQILAYPLEYKHLNADYFLAWGNYSRHCAQELDIPLNKIVVVGNPKYSSEQSAALRLEKSRNKTIAVFLDGVYPESYERNLCMIEMAESLCRERGLHGLVKLHPSYMKVERLMKEVVAATPHLSICDGSLLVPDLLSQVDFCIASASTVYAEAVELGTPAFRYVPEGMPDLFAQFDLGVFKNGTELFAWVNAYSRDQKSYLEKQRRIAADLFEPGDSAARYRQVFIALVEGEDPNARLARMGLS